VREGQKVKAGDMLLRLEDADARAQAARALTQVRAAEAELAALRAGGTREEVLNTQTQLGTAKAELNAAERNLEAMQRLLKRGAASAAEIRESESRRNAARAQVELLEKKLGSRFAETDLTRAEAQLAEARAAYDAAQQLVRNANVRAPRVATVYSLPVREGQFMNAGDLLVQTADLKQMQVRAFVDEPEIGNLRKDQPVIVTWDALPGKSWEGRVTQVPTTVVTRGTRTVGEAITLIENPDQLLLPKVNVSARIVTAQEQNAIIVPREAVRGESGEYYVYLIQDGQLQRRPVQTGISNLTDIQITQGLSGGEQVATTSLTGAPLEPGMKVRTGQ
jgi:HlyD family secretion protein